MKKREKESDREGGREKSYKQIKIESEIERIHSTHGKIEREKERV